MPKHCVANHRVSKARVRDGVRLTFTTPGRRPHPRGTANWSAPAVQQGCLVVPNVIAPWVIALALVVVSAGQSAADWPRFLGPQFDGIVHDADLIQAADRVDWNGKPSVTWSLPVGEGYGIGVTAADRYYHFDAAPDSTDRRVVGRRSSITERLRCVDLASGQIIWTQQNECRYQDLYGYEAGPRSSPTVHQDSVYTLGVRGRLTCRSLSDGTERWSVETVDQFAVVQNFFGVGSAPLVIDDLVIVMVGGSPDEDQVVPPGQLNRVSPNGTGLVAFNRNTGQVRWQAVDDLASNSSPRPIQIDNKACVLLLARDHLWCVDAKAGTTLWKFHHRSDLLESVNAMTPVVDGSKVFISECYELGSVLLEVDPSESQTAIWQDPRRDRRRMAMRCHWATPVLVNGYLYGCSGRNAPDSDFRCVDLMTGTVKWTGLERRRSSVTAVGDHLLVLEERGTLHIAKADPEALSIKASHDLATEEAFANGDTNPALQYPCWSAPLWVAVPDLAPQILLRGDQTVLCLQFPMK
ncbi:outer membrane biogenesis protein BamB [Crateriforma conspicua]|uniref:Outer membrane biogenesis protein BamB n=1 Tax=Crateriforma conspicua TaxID=2527996 RepID=A0A5C5Y6Y1_9PLAN|nr:outer membrane biogenesis protein BamB [Crateriforma conspicua]